ncbi:protein sieve element occlusion b [Quercus suber]|uniref:Protein sieve element occlusion b n=1 Tax=Quercus suber TaxID=58331 RepID=A0AAW0KI27_QUESU
MDSKAVTGPVQKPNATTPAQQPSQASNVQLQATPLLQPGQQLGPLQPTSNLGSVQRTSNPAGTYQQPNPQANFALQQQTPQTNYALQQPNPQTNYGAVQQQNPQTKQVPFQPPNQQTSLIPYQQPNPQTNLGAWQQPTPLGSLQPSTLLSKLTPNATHQLIRGDRSMLTMSDDNALVSHILGSHTPDGRDFDVKPLLRLGSQTYLDSGFDDKTHHMSFLAILEALSYTIDRIACELAYKALGGTDAHQTTVAICNMVSHYGWDAKLVLALAAFGLNYGEFWLLAQIYSTNQLAKAMAILKQVPGIIEHAVPLKPRFDALNDLIRTILEVTWCVIEFKDLPSIYITTDVPALASAMIHIPTAVYWTIRSIVACASQISSFTNMGYEFALSTSEAWELSTLTHKLKTILEHLKKKMEECVRYIGKPQTSNPTGTYQQPNPQANFALQQPTPQTNYALQQPIPQTKQVPFQPSNQQTSLVPYQQPNPQTNLGAWQRPTPLGSLQPSTLVSKLTPNATHQLIRVDRSMLTMSDDNALVSHILGSHTPDGRDFDGSQTYLDSGFDDKTHHMSFLAMLEALSYTIDRIACEALGGTDAHQTTVAICNMVSHYGWDAKLVLALAAFGLNYGEFWLLAQIYSTNQLAKAMAILKQVPGIIEHAVPLKPRFDALNDLIRTILDVTWCIIEFKDLPSIYITTDVPALASAMIHIPTAVYWTIRSIVACASQISSFTNMGYEFALSTSEAWELSTLTHKLKTILEHLKKKMEECVRYIGKPVLCCVIDHAMPYIEMNA